MRGVGEFGCFSGGAVECGIEGTGSPRRNCVRQVDDRDASAFASFLAAETVFVSEGKATRGAAQVAAAWKRFFDGPRAPFSWEPETVEVLDSGTLALSSGPVRDPSGKRIGTFNSVWRRDANGQWKIVLDNGCPACNCDPPR
jgi:ketosteroid isomerase-like protein